MYDKDYHNQSENYYQYVKNVSRFVEQEKAKKKIKGR